MATKLEEMNEQFNKSAAYYEKAFSSGTRPIAVDALALMPAVTSNSVVHDNACGPGVVTFLVADKAKAERLDPMPEIHATDLAEGMIKVTEAGIQKRELKTVKAEVMNSQDLSPFKDNMFTHSITNFVIFALPDPVKAAKEIHRTLQPGGVAAVTVWKHAGSTALLHRVHKAIRPNDPELVPFSKDWEESWKIASVMEEAGFAKGNMKVVPRDGFWETSGTEEIVDVFAHPFWDAFRKGWSEEEKGKWNGAVREQLLEEEKRSGNIRMEAWICVAKK